VVSRTSSALAYNGLKGDGSIIARVMGISNAEGKAGVMIRETLDSNSTHAMVAVSGDHRLSFLRRPQTGAASTSTDVATSGFNWIKLTRSGNTFTAQLSMDGVTWPPWIEPGRFEYNDGHGQ